MMDKDLEKYEKMLSNYEQSNERLVQLGEEKIELDTSLSKMGWEYTEILRKEDPNISEFMIQFKLARKFEDEYLKLEELKKKVRQQQNKCLTQINRLEFQEMVIKRQTCKNKAVGE